MHLSAGWTSLARCTRHDCTDEARVLISEAKGPASQQMSDLNISLVCFERLKDR